MSLYYAINILRWLYLLYAVLSVNEYINYDNLNARLFCKY